MENKGGQPNSRGKSEGKSENWQGKTTAFKTEQITEFPPRVHRGAAMLADRPSGWKGRARAGNGRHCVWQGLGKARAREGTDGREGERDSATSHPPPQLLKLLKLSNYGNPAHPLPGPLEAFKTFKTFGTFNTIETIESLPTLFRKFQ